MTTSAGSSMIAAKRFACVAFALAAFSVAPAAQADGPRADALFKEGRALFDAKRYDEACPKLAESQRLEPGAGTMLALALCHEQQGKTATAWRELREAARLGRSVGRSDLAAAAQKRADAMEPRLSRLVVRMPEAADGYEVRCDEEKLDGEALGKPFAVDPGEHKVEVSASGKKSRSYAVRLAGAGLVEILVEPLEDVPTRTLAVARKPAPRLSVSVEPPPPVEESRGGTQRAIGLALACAASAGT